MGSPIRISAGRWIFAPIRSFSQLVTSFFGSWCQGIRRMLLFAWPRRNSPFLLHFALRKISLFWSVPPLRKKQVFFGILSDFRLFFTFLSFFGIVKLSRTISRSPWVLWDFMWVSFAVLFLFKIPRAAFAALTVTLFLFEKTFFLTPSSYSVFKQQMR